MAGPRVTLHSWIKLFSDVYYVFLAIMLASDFDHSTSLFISASPWIKNCLKVTVVWSCDAVQSVRRRLWPFPSPVDPLTSLMMLFILITRDTEVATTRIICLFLRSVHKSRPVLTFFVRLTGTFHIANKINPLKPELNPICYLLALLGAHHFLHVSRIGVKLLTLRWLMSYIYIWSTHSWCF